MILYIAKELNLINEDFDYDPAMGRLYSKEGVQLSDGDLYFL